MLLLLNFSTFLDNFVKNCIFKAKISIVFLILLKTLIGYPKLKKKIMEGLPGLKGNYVGEKRKKKLSF